MKIQKLLQNLFQDGHREINKLQIFTGVRVNVASCEVKEPNTLKEALASPDKAEMDHCYGKGDKFLERQDAR